MQNTQKININIRKRPCCIRKPKRHEKKKKKRISNVWKGKKNQSLASPRSGSSPHTRARASVQLRFNQSIAVPCRLFVVHYLSSKTASSSYSNSRKKERTNSELHSIAISKNYPAVIISVWICMCILKCPLLTWQHIHDRRGLRQQHTD